MKIKKLLLNIKNHFKNLIILIFKTNITIGKNVVIDYKTNLFNFSNTINIGDNVFLRSSTKGYHASMPFATTLLIDVKGAKICIGNNSSINGVYIHSQKEIVIGANCVIASGVIIIDSNGHELCSKNRTIGRDIPEAIIIGNNVWIGLNAVILKGTIIGDNSVVSAGSIVKGNFPMNALIVGNPAKTVKILDI